MYQVNSTYQLVILQKIVLTSTQFKNILAEQAGKKKRAQYHHRKETFWKTLLASKNKVFRPVADTKTLHKSCLKLTFLTHRHAVYQCLKKPLTFFRHANVYSGWRKRCFWQTVVCLRDTRHFRRFRPFLGSEESNPLFLVGRM